MTDEKPVDEKPAGRTVNQKAVLTIAIVIGCIIAFVYVVFLRDPSVFIEPYVKVDGVRMTANEWVSEVASEPIPDDARAWANYEGKDYIGKKVTIVGRVMATDVGNMTAPYRTKSGDAAEAVIERGYLILDECFVAVEIPQEDAWALGLKQGDLVRVTGVIDGYELIENMTIGRALILDEPSVEADLSRTHIESISYMDAVGILLAP